MFQILAGGIQQAYEELSSQISKRQILINQVSDVVRNLETVSGMEDITRELGKQIAILEMEQRSYIQMMQALNLVITYYEECEKRIISKSELGTKWSFKVTFKSNDFSSIAKELKDIKLE